MKMWSDKNMSECHKELNQEHCNCSYPCDKQGLCCECLIYHRQRDELPACYFPDDIERTYDRTITNFVHLHQKNK